MCVTAGTVTVKADGRGITATAALTLTHACLRTATSAAAGGYATAGSAFAPFPEHPGTSVRIAQHVEKRASLQGEHTLMH